MTSLATKQILDIEPQMILEVAYGIEDPEAVALRYGFSECEWLLLKEHKPFIRQVEEKRVELSASGYTFKMKAGIAAEAIMEKVARKALDDDASFHTQLESLKFFAKAAGTDAPAKVEREAGPGFSITVVLSGGQTVEIKGSQDQVVDVDPEDVTYEMDIGPAPAHLGKVIDLMEVE